MSVGDPIRVRFGEFEADLQTGELYLDGKRAPIQAKAFDLLRILLACRGSLVSREELNRRLWPTTHVDFRLALNVTVHKLRQVLCDSPQSPRFIETVGSRGYRFLPEQEASRTVPLTIPPAPANLRVVFMPLRNLGSNEHDSFAQLFTDRLIAAVTRIAPNLAPVIPSALVHHRHTEDAARVCRESGAHYMLTTTFIAIDGHACITAKLVRGEDRCCLWAESFSSKLNPGLQGRERLSAHIARSMAARLPRS